jgi:hypothetical protein
MAVFAGPEIANSGLILHLDAANRKSYPGTGTTWTDLSGNSNHSTINTGNYNLGGYFESTGDNPSVLRVTTPDSTTLSNTFKVTTGGWTIEEIVLIDDTTYPESTAGATFGTTPYNIGAIGFDWAHGTATASNLNLTVNDGTTLVRQDIALNIVQSQYDKWLHRTFVFDRTLGQVRVYYDGIYQNMLNISSVTGIIYNNVGIGWGQLYGWQHDGFRAGMKIYNRVLTAQEISQNYEAYRDRYGI